MSILPVYWERHLQIGGEASVNVVQREEKYKSDAYKDYVRPHRVDAKAMSEMFADADAQLTLQPAQGTVWDING